MFSSLDGCISGDTAKLGRSQLLVDLAERAGVDLPKRSVPPIISGSEGPYFIENKVYDFERIAQLMGLSERINHHANRGPVSTLLEEMVAKLIGLPKQRRVVAVCSATAGMHAAAGYLSLAQQKTRSRWLASAFGFYSSAIGPFGMATLLDSDPNGRLSCSSVLQVPRAEYDGIVYTNIFAQHSDWYDHKNLSISNGKALLIDNATGLFDRPVYNSDNIDPIEVISFHHTKPWGVGEGGVIVCDESQEDEIRKLISFGVGMRDGSRVAASNTKISDLSAAAIIDRLEKYPTWAQQYIAAEKYWAELLAPYAAQIKPLLGTTSTTSPRAYTPFSLAPDFATNLTEGPIVLRKYYRPLQSSPNAVNLFEKILCIPNCPAAVTAPTEPTLRQVLAAITSKNV